MSDQADSTDEQLMADAGQGQARAFAEVVRRHSGAVWRLARILVPQHAEDILQETFVAALRSASTYRGEASVRGWLLTIARNNAARIHRRLRPDVVDDETLEQLGAAAGWGAPTPEEAATQAERRDAVTRALATLPEDDRAILLMRDVEELSGEDVAAALGISLAAQKSRVHRARLRLVAALHRQGGDHAP